MKFSINQQAVYCDRFQINVTNCRQPEIYSPKTSSLFPFPVNPKCWCRSHPNIPIIPRVLKRFSTFSICIEFKSESHKTMESRFRISISWYWGGRWRHGWAIRRVRSSRGALDDAQLDSIYPITIDYFA